MTISEKYNTIRKACDEQRFCEILCRGEKSATVIQPFGICITYKRGLIIVARQSEEHYQSRSSTDTVSKLRNFPLEDCDHVRILENKFNVFPDFYQYAKECNDWLFHVHV